MNTYDVLVAARKLIDTPEKWTKGAYARNLIGQPVPWNDPSASCFCALGALNRVFCDKPDRWSKGDLDLYTRALDILRVVSGEQDASTFNDSSTHAEFLKVWDNAIQQAVFIKGYL